MFAWEPGTWEGTEPFQELQPCPPEHSRACTRVTLLLLNFCRAQKTWEGFSPSQAAAFRNQGRIRVSWSPGTPLFSEVRRLLFLFLYFLIHRITHFSVVWVSSPLFNCFSKLCATTFTYIRELSFPYKTLQHEWVTTAPLEYVAYVNDFHN